MSPPRIQPFHFNGSDINMDVNKRITRPHTRPHFPDVNRGDGNKIGIPRGMNERDFHVLRKLGYSEQELFTAQEIMDHLADLRHLDYLEELDRLREEEDAANEGARSYRHAESVEIETVEEEADV